MSAVSALRLESICRSYRSGDERLDVLTDLDLEVRSGELVALIAPSGAGKSTLLHVAGLLERPDSGDVYVDGIATRDLADKARTGIRRTGIGFIYQFHHLLPEFSALENVAIPQMANGLSYKNAAERARELLGYLKLSERLDHRPAELSGGEQQRVAIARSIANAPHIILADEPTGNLDPSTSDLVFSMLTRLAREAGIAALIATHNLDLARRADRTVTLKDGKTIAHHFQD
ncbi:MAG: ABC transporter ATP-binding protein [Hyphomicrobiaceae bacterium]|nr:ABC transporter ATP-binding protein [Hyphomicrobiaceae bacterium]